MSSPVDEFVNQAPGVVDAESHHEGQYIHSYRGRLDGNGDAVWILTLAPDIDDDAVFETFTRVTGEWQNASTHPNIVTVYGRDDTPRPWVAIENVAGQPLDAAQPNLAPGESKTVIDNVTEAVRNVALYNTTHGALSPDQVWIDPGDDGVSAVVDDWGLRRAVSRAAGSIDVTPFTAPELLADPNSVTQQTDVYGLGAVAYYTLTGNPPVSGSNLEQIIQNGEIALPSSYDDTLSEAVDDVLLQALAPNPDERYDSAYTFKRAFGQAFTPDTEDNDENSTAAPAGATAGEPEQQAEQVETDDDSMVSRRATLGMLGVGTVALGGGWMAMQIGGDEESNASVATDTRTETSIDSRTTGPTETETPTEPSSGNVLFSDEFENSELLDQWRYADDEQPSASNLEMRDSVLYHQAPFGYGGEDNGDIITQSSFEETGTVRLSARIRTIISDYWGYGFSLRFANNGITLKNHRWEGFDRFAAFGVENRPEEYSSDYDAYGEQTNKAKFASATTHSDFVLYSMTVDIDNGELLQVRRGEETWSPSLDIGDTTGSYNVHLGAGGGHEIEVDSIRLEQRQ